MSSPRATEPTLSQGLPGMRRRHESLEADFATPASATYALVPDDDDLTDPVVSSNVHLPTAIAAQLAEARTERRLTTGEFIIWAIEETLDHLNDYVHPRWRGRRAPLQSQGSGIDIAGKSPDHAGGLFPSRL